MHILHKLILRVSRTYLRVFSLAWQILRTFPILNLKLFASFYKLKSVFLMQVHLVYIENEIKS